MVLIPLWALSFVWGADIGTGWPPTLWHGHEMLFGFITCAIAGFMLTAVPSWTGQKGFAGSPLIALAVIWIAARILISTSTFWPPLLPAIVDLAFLPLLALLVMIPLIRLRNRNTPLLAVVAFSGTADLVFYLGLMHHDAPLAHKAIIAGIDIALLLITVIEWPNRTCLYDFSASPARNRNHAELQYGAHGCIDRGHALCHRRRHALA